MSMRIMHVFAGRVAPVHALAARCGHRVWREAGEA